MSQFRRHKPAWVGLLIILGVIILVSACAPEPTPEPTPTPTATPTRGVRSPFDENLEALNQAQGLLEELNFGLAPLVELDETSVRLESGPTGPVARLAYPQQPADPTDWPAVDSFVLAYAVRDLLQDSPRVRRISLGLMQVPAPVSENLENTIMHVAVWLSFIDQTQAVVDFSPLASNFAARHGASEFMSDPAQIEDQFSTWRRGVYLDNLQPMTVVERNGGLYYVLARLQILPDQYLFNLQVHPIQPADPMTELHLAQGTMASLGVDRVDFEAFQEDLASAGPSVFEEQPDLLTYRGENSPVLNDILAEHLYLLWHLITKLDHETLKPGEMASPVPTPVPTATSTPTPTPTPTATPTAQRAPLLTS